MLVFMHSILFCRIFILLLFNLKVSRLNRDATYIYISMWSPNLSLLFKALKALYISLNKLGSPGTINGKLEERSSFYFSTEILQKYATKDHLILTKLKILQQKNV